MNIRLLLTVLMTAGTALALRAESIEELRRKASEGNAEAQFRLSCAYRNADRVGRDVAEADRLLRLSAEQGYAQAQCDLGYQYEKGLGAPKDYRLALQWYRRAADQNLAMGMNNVGAIYAAGLGVPKDDAEAFAWFRKGAERGCIPGQNMLGIMIAEGRGTAADPAEAYKWFYIAARQDYPPARENAEKQALVLKAADKARAQREGDDFLKAHRTARRETGTGFFITADGYVLTCYHVVRGAVRITVRAGSEPLDATLVKADDANDLALLKVSGKFRPLPLVSSRDVRLGETVFTIGFPNVGLQGLSPKLTDGTVNSLAGELDCPRFFQVNTAIQPGNSGGPLVNLSGGVIGLLARSLDSTRTAERNDGALPQNINYAIKAGYALAFLESVPEIADKLTEPRGKSKRSLEELAPLAQAATVFIIAE